MRAARGAREGVRGAGRAADAGPPADMMERAIINTFVGHDVVEPGSYVQMFPYPCYTRDE